MSSISTLIASLNRPLPHSHEAEQSVIGGCLIDNNAVDRVIDILSPDDFYSLRHKAIFSAISTLYVANKPTDTISVIERLKQDGMLPEAGHASYIVELAELIFSSANIEHHAKIVASKATMRKAASTITDLAGRALQGNEVPSEFLDEAEAKILSIAKNSIESIVPPSEAIDTAIEHIINQFDCVDNPTGVPTGFYEVDKIIGGLNKQDLIVVAARPAMGKTAFAINISTYATLVGNMGVGFFSMEMPRHQLYSRMIYSLAEVDSSKIRSGVATSGDLERMKRAAETIKDCGLYIDDTSGLSILELKSRARRMVRVYKCSIIVVDYLQLMRGIGEERRELEISTISRSLKGLAKELNVPVVALSQLNRGVEYRADKRPGPADLRESGAIEQDADIIMFLYRDEVYEPDTQDRGLAEVIIAKDRNGPTGTARVAFKSTTGTFANLPKDD